MTCLSITFRSSDRCSAPAQVGGALRVHDSRVNRYSTYMTAERRIRDSRARLLAMKRWFEFFGFDIMGGMAFTEKASKFKLMKRNTEDRFCKTTSKFLPMFALFSPIAPGHGSSLPRGIFQSQIGSQTSLKTTQTRCSGNISETNRETPTYFTGSASRPSIGKARLLTSKILSTSRATLS